MLNSNTSSTCPHNMVNFGPITAENCWRVWGTQQISTGFASWQCYCTVAVGVSQTLRCWTEGATYIRQGGHHVGHWHAQQPVIEYSFTYLCRASVIRWQYRDLSITPHNFDHTSHIVFCSRIRHVIRQCLRQHSDVTYLAVDWTRLTTGYKQCVQIQRPTPIKRQLNSQEKRDL